MLGFAFRRLANWAACRSAGSYFSGEIASNHLPSGSLFELPLVVMPTMFIESGPNCGSGQLIFFCDSCGQSESPSNLGPFRDVRQALENIRFISDQIFGLTDIALKMKQLGVL